MKIRRLLIFLIILAGLGQGLQAQVRFNWGLEWGYTGLIVDWHRFNYFSTDGVRVDDTMTHAEYKSTGQLLVNAGVGLGRHWALGLYSGFTAVYEARKVVPYSLRITYFTNAYDLQGWKFFLDGGSAWSHGGTFRNRPVLIAKAGAGYRIPIYRDFCLDFFTALQFTSDHPLHILDKYTVQPVPPEVLRYSSRQGLGVTLGLALAF